MKLTSDAFLLTEPGLIPQVSLSNLAAHAEGLLALTGGVAGEVGPVGVESTGRGADFS